MKKSIQLILAFLLIVLLYGCEKDDRGWNSKSL